jgi:hypothetical protein
MYPRVEDFCPAIVVPGMSPSFRPPELTLDSRLASTGMASLGGDARTWLPSKDSLRNDLLKERTANAALIRENRFIQRMLDDRDRQFATLQAESAAMRRDWLWRTLGAARSEFRRLRTQIWPSASFATTSGRIQRRRPSRGVQAS